MLGVRSWDAEEQKRRGSIFALAATRVFDDVTVQANRRIELTCNTAKRVYTPVYGNYPIHIHDLQR